MLTWCVPQACVRTDNRALHLSSLGTFTQCLHTQGRTPGGHSDGQRWIPCLYRGPRGVRPVVGFL